MNSKSIIDAQTAYSDYLKNAQAKSIEVVSNAIAKAQQHADQMGPEGIFATACTVTAVLLASYQII
jgi:hypothetical protein